MKISKRFIVFIALGLSSLSYADGKPKYAAPTVPLTKDHAYFQKNKAPDYWAISPFYVAQVNEYSCIPATFTMAVNTLRAQRMKLTASDSNFTQKIFFEKYGDLAPIKRFFKDKGPSISLEETAQILKKVLEENGVKGMKVEFVHVDDVSAKTIAKISSLLVQNEKSSSNLILANMIQGILTGDPEGMVGHFSPVGAYDKARKRVLIMDSDRAYYQPYWVDLEQFVKALNTLDKDAKKNRGILWIHP